LHFAQVDPFALSIRRVRKATQLKYKLLSDNHKAVAPSPVEIKIIRWVNTFHVIAETIVAVYHIRRKHMELNMSMSMAASTTSVPTSVSAHSSLTLSAAEGFERVPSMMRDITPGVSSKSLLDPFLQSVATTKSPATKRILGHTNTTNTKKIATNSNTATSTAGSNSNEVATQPPIVPMIEESVEPLDVQKRVRRQFCVDLANDQSCFDFWQIVYNHNFESKQDDLALSNAQPNNQTPRGTPRLTPRHTIAGTNSAAKPTVAKQGSNSNVAASNHDSRNNSNSDRNTPSNRTPRTPRTVAADGQAAVVIANYIDDAVDYDDAVIDSAKAEGISLYDAVNSADTGKASNNNGTNARDDYGHEGYEEETYEGDDFEPDGVDSDQSKQGTDEPTRRTTQSQSIIARAVSMPRLRGKDQHFIHRHSTDESKAGDVRRPSRAHEYN
jgi:hypothetical protein